MSLAVRKSDKEKRPLLSVVIPIFNTEKYLDRCFNSVLSQTYRPLEIILVDDGSSDRSSELCDIYSKKYVNIKVIHQKNQGAIHARETGLNAMTGDFFTFMDSDDWIEQNFYEEMMRPFKNDPEIDISIGGACIRLY